MTYKTWKQLVHFVPFLFGLLSGTGLDVWQGCSLPTEGDSTNIPFQPPAHPKGQTYTCGCVSEFQKFPRGSVSLDYFHFPCAQRWTLPPPKKGCFCFALLRHSGD